MKKRKIWISAMAGILAAILLLSLLAAAVPTKARAASSSEIREQINELESQQSDLQAQMDELEQQMSDNLSQMEDAVAQKNRIDQQVFLLFQEISNVNEQIDAYRVLIADKQDELDEAKVEYEALREQYRERVRAMEEEGSLSYWSVLFKANSFADLLDRLNMIEEIAASDQRRLRELNNAAQKVADTQEELETEKASLEATKAELDDSQVELDQKRSEADALLNDLRARGEEYEIYMAAAEEEQNELMLQIIEQEAAYDEAVDREYWATYVPPTTTAPPTTAPQNNDSSSGNSGDSSGSSSNSGSSSSSGTWLTPVPYYTLTSPFGWRIHPIYGDWRFHEGVDLACAQGTPIYATRSGVVRSASYNSSMGYYVSIDHDNGYRSIYMHMTHYIVSAGEYVTAGQVIGYVGSTGDSTGPHLHFGIYDCNAGCYVNPMDFIS